MSRSVMSALGPQSYIELGNRNKGLLCATLGVFIISFDALLIRESVPPAAPNEMMFWRYFLSTITLLLITLYFQLRSAEKSKSGNVLSDVLHKFTDMTPISLLAAIFYAYSNIFFLIA